MLNLHLLRKINKMKIHLDLRKKNLIVIEYLLKIQIENKMEDKSLKIGLQNHKIEYLELHHLYFHFINKEKWH